VQGYLIFEISDGEIHPGLSMKVTLKSIKVLAMEWEVRVICRCSRNIAGQCGEISGRIVTVEGVKKKISEII
jgi:hypothetical protein